MTNIVYRPGDLAMSGWTSYNGVANTIGYDSDLRPTGITVVGVQNLTFAYDTADRIIKITNGVHSNYTQTLGYDVLDRLTSVSSSAHTASYTYDGDGNRTYQVVNGVATSFAHAAASNRLNSATGGVNVTYGYNAYGSTTTVNGATAYSYDPFGRLVNAGGAAFLISAEDQRLRKMFGGDTTYFIPDAGGALLADSQNGTWRDYVWLNWRMVAMITGGSVYSLHGDQTGRTLAITGSTAAIVWEAQGLPFDRNTIAGSSSFFRLGFPGQYWDVEDSLWHNGYRDYDYQTGRYVQSDPIGLGGGINTYAYVGNNPVSNIDPLRLCDEHRCNKLQQGLAKGAVQANKFANATGDVATGAGLAALGAAALAPASDGATLVAAAPLAAASGGLGSVSTATSVVSGLLNTAASGGDMRYMITPVLTSTVGRIVGAGIRVIPFVHHAADAVSGYVEGRLGSWAALPPPCMETQ